MGLPQAREQIDAWVRLYIIPKLKDNFRISLGELRCHHVAVLDGWKIKGKTSIFDVEDVLISLLGKKKYSDNNFPNDIKELCHTCQLGIRTTLNYPG